MSAVLFSPATYTENIYLIKDPITVPAGALLGCSILSLLIALAASCIIFGVAATSDGCLGAISFILCTGVFASTLAAVILFNKDGGNREYMLNGYSVINGTNKTDDLTVTPVNCYYSLGCTCNIVPNATKCADITNYGTNVCINGVSCCQTYQEVCVQYSSRKRPRCEVQCAVTLYSQKCTYMLTKCNNVRISNTVTSDDGVVAANYLIQGLYYATDNISNILVNTTRDLTYAPWSFDITELPAPHSKKDQNWLLGIIFGWPLLYGALGILGAIVWCCLCC